MPEIFQYTFFQNSLLGCFLASILCSMVGTYVVTRRMVIAGGGVAHASLGGVGLGAYFGFSPLLGAAGFALLASFGTQWLGKRKDVREDSAIAMLWTFGMSLGILFAFLAPGFMTDLPAYLFGDVLSITSGDLVAIGILALLSVVIFISVFSALIAVAYDRDFAITQGLPVVAIETTMTILTALTIVSCLHVVGIVMVISLLSVPQLTAAMFVKTFRAMIFVSAIFGYVGCVGGLWLSYGFNVPSGAAIILVGVGIYFLCRAIKSICSVFNKRMVGV